MQIMYTMKNFAAQQLSKAKMNDITGGISREEYCAKIDAMIKGQMNVQTWTNEEWTIATWAWNERCAGKV